MPTEIIRPRGRLTIKFPVPRSGIVEYTVEANRPVDTFVVDEEGLRQLKGRGSDVTSYYGGFYNRYDHHQELRLPFRGWWYLVVDSRQGESVAVHYEVSG